MFRMICLSKKLNIKKRYNEFGLNEPERGGMARMHTDTTVGEDVGG